MEKIRAMTKKFLIKIWVNDKTIDKLYEIFYLNVKNRYTIIKNYLRFKSWKIEKLEYELKRKVLINKEQFWDDNFYQSYPPLWLKWDRDALDRFKTYELKKYINKKSEILDIWGNLCFFSIYTSRFVKHIEIVEYNSNLVEIWNILKEHEKIQNVDILKQDFKKYKPWKKFDIIFSFAIHMWVWMPFRDYLEKIHSLLKKDWLVFLESNFLKLDPFEKNIEDIKDIFKIIYIKDSNDHKWITRKIALLKKLD